MREVWPPGAGFQLDSFDVVGVLGRGAMGEVLDAVHRPSRRPVAIKTLPPSAFVDPVRLSAFQGEIRVAAELIHPSIVQVFDVGRVSRLVQDASEGRLPADSPYLVMERVEGTDLSVDTGPTSWARLEEILTQLLWGLAHAHAHGVIHRDIKPGNVLVEEATGLIKITDFGLAHVSVGPRGTEASEATWGGTPPYMAPEQFDHRWRDFGPWTDLYSVGCLAFALATGRPPYGRGTPVDMAWRHLREPVPELPEGVPKKLAAWIRILLSKRTDARFQRAADAARALAENDAPRPATWGLGGLTPGTDVSTVELATALRSAVDQSLTGEWKLLSTEDFELPPADEDVPTRWAGPAWSPGPSSLPGAGMGLLGVRSFPMVGRRELRDRLWKELVATARERTPRLVLLHGDAGVGKSRLTRWLAERAHELGAAESLLAVHSSRPSAGDGIGAMLRRHLHCAGMDARELSDRLTQAFPGRQTSSRLLRRTLAALVSGPSGGGEAVSPKDRHRAVAAVVRRLGRDRPVVVRLDDLQWGAESAEWVESLIARKRPEAMPLLILATVRRQGRDPHAAHGAPILERLAARPEVVEIDVPPLDPDERGLLLLNVLGLDGNLAARVEARCGGNTLFMLQLVQSWVVADRLVPGPNGYALTQGTEVDTTRSLDGVARGRLAGALREAGAQHGGALNVAAALGLEVDVDRWRHVCAAAGLEDPAPLELTLLKHGLLRRDAGAGRGRVAFAHGALRDCVEREARRTQAWRVANRICAEALASGPVAVSPVDRAAHLVEAGDDEAALPILVRSLKDSMGRETMWSWPRRLDLLAGVIERLQLPADHEARGWSRFVVARIAQLRNQADDAYNAFAALEAEAEANGWEEVLVAALCSRALAATHRAMPAVAMECANRVADQLRSLSGTTQFGRCCRLLGLVHKQAGRIDQAEQWFRLGVEQAHPDSTGSRSECHRGLSDLALQRGDVEAAQVELNAAMALLESSSEAPLINALGEVARLRGDTEAACAHYEDAVEVSRFYGTTLPAALFNLGLAKLELKDFRAARSTFIEGTRMSSVRGGSPWDAVAALGLVVADAGLANWTDWESRCAAAVEAVRRTAWVEADFATMARLGGALGAAAGQVIGAGHLDGLANEQLALLGRTDEAKTAPSVRD